MSEHSPLIQRRKKSYSRTLFPPRRRNLRPRLDEIFAETSEPASRIFSVTLANTGSVARDHLAAERTFLAYVRTCIAIASAGVALVQLFTMRASLEPSRKLFAFARPIGATTVILGFLVLIMGIIRYYSVQAAMLQNKYPVARLMPGVTSILLALLVSVVFAILVAEH